jgi:hypothetical protein
LAEPDLLYHDASASNAARTVTSNGSSWNGDVRVVQAGQMTAAPISWGSAARMTMLHRDARTHADPNGSSVVVRLDLGDRRRRRPEETRSRASV